MAFDMNCLVMIIGYAALCIETTLADAVANLMIANCNDDS